MSAIDRVGRRPSRRDSVTRRLKAALLACVCLLALPAVTTAAHVSIAAIRELSHAQLNQKQPVKTEGVVYGIIPRTGRLMVQDEGKGLILIPSSKDSLPPVGARIAVEGFTESQGSTMVKAARITVLDATAGQPAPESLSLAAALSRKLLRGAFVETPGMVLNIRTNGQNVAPFLGNRFPSQTIPERGPHPARSKSPRRSLKPTGRSSSSS